MSLRGQLCITNQPSDRRTRDNQSAMKVLISLFMACGAPMVASAGGLRKSRGLATSGGGKDPPNTPGVNFHSQFSKTPYNEEFQGGKIKQLNYFEISNITMGIGQLELYPGGVRELHWHPFSAEWGYVTKGICRINLMDNDGQYDNYDVGVGYIWNFPKSWGHVIQGIHEDDGCSMVLFFDAPYYPTTNSEALSQIPTAFNPDVVAENLGVSRSILSNMYQTGANFDYEMSQGPFPVPPLEKSVNPLPNSPIIRVDEGTCTQVGSGGYLYLVRDDVFPGATTMSGGFMHLANGTLRDIHWHPNANEMQFVLKGRLKVGIYGIGGVRNTFILGPGDVGFVPQGYAHYLEAVNGDTDFLLTFDSPNWQTQELSTWLAVTPSYLTAASINTTTEVVETYFPRSEEQFIGGEFVGCPSIGEFSY